MPDATKPRRHRYLLGDSARETARLRAQARLWDPVSRALFDRIGIARGARVLEIGPGAGSLHLELRRRVRGPVDAVEPSRVFAGRLRRRCRRDGLGEGRIWETTLQEAALPRRHYDLIFARWVFLFLPDHATHLRKLAGALRPGGTLALQDYHRGSLAMVPEPAHWASFVQADRRFFSRKRVDASVGTRLPALMKDAGFVVREVRPTIQAGAPGSPAWSWLTNYFFSVMGTPGGIRPFTPAQARRLRRAWAVAASVPTSLLIAPAVLDVVGTRRR